MRSMLRLYGGALLAGMLGMAVMLGAWRIWSDYRDFQMMRAFVFSVIQQQQQHPQTPTRGEKPQ